MLQLKLSINSDGKSSNREVSPLEYYHHDGIEARITKNDGKDELMN